MLLFSVSPSASLRTISLPTLVSSRKRGGELAETRVIIIIMMIIIIPETSITGVTL